MGPTTPLMPSALPEIATNVVGRPMTRSVSCERAPVAKLNLTAANRRRFSMPAIHHQIHIKRPPQFVWEAVRDVGALHSRLVPGFVTATEMLTGVTTPTRRVTFGNGVVADEVIVDNDDERRRLAWSIRGIESVEHHNGVMTVLDAEGGT